MNTARYYVLATLFSFSAYNIQARHFFKSHTPLFTWNQSPSNKSDVFELNTYTSSYYKTAHTTFLEHSLNTTHPLSALIFGKETFRLSNIFQDCQVPSNTQYYNPYMRILTINPRISYSEKGTHLGASFHTRFLKSKKALVGIRINVPFKHRHIERLDTGSRGPAQTENVASQQTFRLVDGSHGLIKTTQAYRLDFIEALPQNISGDSALTYGTDSVVLFQNQISADGSSPSLIGEALLYSPEGIIPRGRKIGVLNPALGETGAQVTANLPTTLQALSTANIYQFQGATSYQTIADTASKDIQQRIQDQNAKASLWVIPTFKTWAEDNSMPLDSRASTIQSSISSCITGFNENSYEWLCDRGYVMETDQIAGLGDISSELFFSYEVSADLSLQANAGVTAPTASGNRSYRNPYTVHLGNINHTELFAGCGASWDMFGTTLNVTGKAQYNRALRDTEERCATPRDAQIRNMGPATIANVWWESVTGDVAFTLCHPHTRSVAVSAGYNLYLRSKDYIEFTQDAASWLGKIYNTTTKDYTTANILTLDPAVAAKNTQVVTHTARASILYQPSRWVQFNASGAFVFAGKNCPKDIELTVGCVITF